MPGICHRCEKTVYFNEERMAIGKSFHKTCFVCVNKGCGRRLDSGNLTEHNGDVYCRSCYGKLFGPRGYGYGAGVMQADTVVNKVVVNEPTAKPIGETIVVKTASSVSSSISPSASPSPVNSVSSTPSPQPPSSIEASSGSTPVSSGTCSPTSDEAISLESDKRETPSPNGSTTSSTSNGSTTVNDVTTSPTTITPTINLIENNNKGSVARMVNNNNSINSIANGIAAKLKFGASEICPRCNKAVYMAERMMGGGSAWHKTSCFNCKECHKRLESTTLCEKDHEIYCKTCYRKNWGPKGYGYGVTALQSCK